MTNIPLKDVKNHLVSGSFEKLIELLKLACKTIGVDVANIKFEKEFDLTGEPNQKLGKIVFFDYEIVALPIEHTGEIAWGWCVDKIHVIPGVKYSSDGGFPDEHETFTISHTIRPEQAILEMIKNYVHSNIMEAFIEHDIKQIQED